MTKQEANQQGVHFTCGGRLQTGEKPGRTPTLWIVVVRCTKCDKRVINHMPYRRALQGDEAKADRRRQAIKEFNDGPMWEQDD